MALSDPTPSSQNKVNIDGLAAHPTYTLADGLGSGTSPVTRINQKGTGVLHLEAASSSAFEVELQYRPDSSHAWSSVATFSDSDTNENDAIDESVQDVEVGDYQIDHNSGESVTVTLRV
jgi:hypothetical protein